MEKAKVLDLLRQSLQSLNQFDALVKVSEASKLISKSLVLSQTYQLASDCDILKLLIYSIPINPNNTLFLLQTILIKHQSNSDLIENCWRIFEFIANIQDNEKLLSLHKKYLEQIVNNNKRTIKILEFQEQYLLKRLVELKKYILKLLPQLYQLIHKNFPETMVDKLFILKILKANSKNEQIISKSASLSQQTTLKYCPQLQNTQRHPIINKTKKHTMKKIQTQHKSSVEKSILQESVASNSPDIYSLLKSEMRTEAFLTYIICPKTIPADDRIWLGMNQELGIKSSEDIRKQVSVKLLTSGNFVREMESHFSDLLVMFFNLIQRFFKETDLDSIIKILTSFLEKNPIPVSVMIMQTSFIQKIFYNLEMQSVYNFIYTFTTLQYKWIRHYKDLFYEYFRLSGFFQLLLNNIDGKKMQYLNPLKTKEFTEIEVKLESRAVELKIDEKRDSQIIDLDLSELQQFEGEYQFEEPTEKNLQIILFTRNKTNTPSMMSTTSNTKKSTHLRSLGTRQSVQNKKPQNVPTTILPPFAVKQYRGYFSTAPVLNFNAIQKTEVVEPHQNWCYTNSKLYYEILHNLVSQNKFQLLDFVLPNNEQLEKMFTCFKKYKSVGLNFDDSNSAIQIIKTISLILKNQQLRKKYNSLSGLCQKNITHLYPIINILFHKQNQITFIQKLTIHKTIDTHTLFIIQTFLLMLKAIDCQSKADVLDGIDESLWQILCLLFFDSMLHNVYQTIVFQIFTELFTYGSEILLLNILFKSNLVGTLYNAYSDIVKNGVIITEWHIHSFFVYIYKLYLLIKNTRQQRTNISQVSFGLSKMLSWTLLQTKIKQTIKKDIDQINQFVL